MTIEMKVTATIGSDGAKMNATFEDDYNIQDVMVVLEMLNTAVIDGIQKYATGVKVANGRNLTKQEIDQLIAKTTIGKIGL